MSGQETEKDGRKVKPDPLPIPDAEAAELAELMENEKREWKKRAQLKIRPPLSARTRP